MTFRVGDKVKVVDRWITFRNINGELSFEENRIYVIEDIEDWILHSIKRGIKIKLHGISDWWYFPHWFIKQNAGFSLGEIE